MQSALGFSAAPYLDSTKLLGVPDVFHIHGWPAGILAILLRTVYYFDPALKNVSCLLTIHNSDRQGWFPRDTVEKLLLPWDVYTTDRAEFYGTFDFLKGGIVYSDAINTVSRKYAEEIQTAEFGNGLDGVLRSRASGPARHLERRRLPGVEPRNGQQDSRLTTNPNGSKAKLPCRKDLLHAFGISQVADSTPIVGMVSRLASQKGFDLLAQACDALLQEDMFLVILGTG